MVPKHNFKDCMIAKAQMYKSGTVTFHSFPFGMTYCVHQISFWYLPCSCYFWHRKVSKTAANKLRRHYGDT